MLLKFGKRADPNLVAPFHALMVLRGRKRMPPPCLHHLQTRAAPRSIRGSQRIRIKPDAVADMARARTAVSQMDCHAIIRLPRQNPHRCAYRTPAIPEIDNILVREL